MLRGLRARLAEEDHKNLAAHVERGKEGRNRQQNIDEQIVLVSIKQNLVLRPEAGQWENARERQRADEVNPFGDRQLCPQPAHVAHVLGIWRLVAGGWWLV